MNRLHQVLVLACLASMGGGCANIHGKWSLANVEPTAARRDFEYTSLTLQKDGTFYGEAQNGSVKSQSGTYSFHDGILDLVAHNGERDTYDAAIRRDKLMLEQFWKGNKVKAEFIRKE